MLISIIIPVRNGGDSFTSCLESIGNISPNLAEVIVVDDGSTDDSLAKARKAGAITFSLPQSSGPANARNIGAQHAKGDILFFMDADVMLFPDTLERIRAAFRNDPDMDALIGSYDDAPGAANFLSQYKNLFHHYTHQTASRQACTFWGACGAVRANAFFAVGGFDKRYRYPSVEDIDLGYRLVKAGYSIQLDKTVQVKHLKHWKPISLLKAEVFYRALPWTTLIWRDRQFVNDLNLKESSRLSVILVYSLLIALLATGWSAQAWLLVVAFSATLFLLNIPVYRFFQRKRGLWFAARTVPWHWLYFMYGGLAFAVGTIRYHVSSHMSDSVFSHAPIELNTVSGLSSPLKRRP